LRSWITGSIKLTLLNKGIKAESRSTFSLDEFHATYKRLALGLALVNVKKLVNCVRCCLNICDFFSNTGIRHGTEAIGIMWSKIRYFMELDKKVYLEGAVDGEVGILRDTNRVTRSLYCLRHICATLRLGSGTYIYQLATQLELESRCWKHPIVRHTHRRRLPLISCRLETMRSAEQ
jgi:hypothetical protein